MYINHQTGQMLTIHILTQYIDKLLEKSPVPILLNVSWVKEFTLWATTGQVGTMTFEERRNRADLLEIFKLIKGFTAVSWLLLLLISSYDQYASSSFTSNNVMSVDKLQTVKSQKVYI